MPLPLVLYPRLVLLIGIVFTPVGEPLYAISPNSYIGEVVSGVIGSLSALELGDEAEPSVISAIALLVGEQPPNS